MGNLNLNLKRPPQVRSDWVAKARYCLVSISSPYRSCFFFVIVVIVILKNSSPSEYCGFCLISGSFLQSENHEILELSLTTGGYTGG